MSPTIVICSGAWPLVKFFEPLIQAFAAQNHTAICKVPEYDAINTEDIPDRVYLRNHVLDPLLEEGKDVVLFMHSYGGVYGPASLKGISKNERASKGLQGGVIAAIFAAGVIAPKGTNAVEAMGLDPQNLPDYLEHDAATDLVSFRKEAARAILFHDLPSEEGDRLAGMMPAQPMACFATPVHWDPYHDANFKGLLGYIYTEEDRIVPLAVQEKYVEMAGITRTYMMKNSSHSPHLKQPEELARVVLDLVRVITER